MRAIVLARRTDIPQWLKDAGMMVRPQTNADAAARLGTLIPESQGTLENNLANYLRAIEVYGRNVPGIWYAWWINDKSKSAATLEFLGSTANGNDGQLVEPIPGLPEANRQIVAAGGYPLAYINAILYDMGDAGEWPAARDAAERDILGTFE